MHIVSWYIGVLRSRRSRPPPETRSNTPARKCSWSFFYGWQPRTVCLSRAKCELAPANLPSIEQMNAKMLILLTDVDGVYNKHPKDPGAKVPTNAVGLYCCTVVRLYCCTVVGLNCCIVVRLYCYIVVRLKCCIVVRLNCCIVVRLKCYIVVRLNCCIVVWLCGCTVVRLNCCNV